jgi:hypothetical protein
MVTTLRFTQKFADSILSLLHCHDRVILKGYLPFYQDAALNNLSDYGLRLRRMSKKKGQERDRHVYY